MRNGNSVEMKLPSLDELFSSQEERDDAKLRRIYEIPLEEIDPFPDHPISVFQRAEAVIQSAYPGP